VPLALLLLMVCALASGAVAQSGPPQRYSADWLVASQGLSQTWRVQVDGQRMRADLTAYELVDLQLYTCPQRAIVRHDLRQIGLAIPYRQRYEAFAYDPALDLSDLDRREGVEALGDESVNGESATRFRSTQNGDTVLFWLAKADGVLLKAASTRPPGYALEVRNLKRGPQPASAFELPAGLTRVDRTGESAADLANGLLDSLLPSLASLVKTGRLETLSAEQRDAVLRDCRAVELAGLFGR
jgi:hypothetical protein